MTDHPTNDESMNEQQIREALTGLAGAPGVPDEAAGWDQVRTRVEHDRREFRRSAWVGLSSVAAAAAAVVGFLVLTDGDGRQTVEVGPIDTPTTVEQTPPTTISAPSSVPTSPPAGFPARPLAVVVSENDVARLDLYDADSGALVTGGLATSFFSISEVSFGPNGTVYFTEELGDTNTVRAVPWDGSAEPVSPFGIGNEATSPALSPDGRTFGYVHQGVTTEGGEIILIDTASGSQRILRWDPDEDNFFLPNSQLKGLEWSPDGSRLLFVSSYEGSEPMVLDASADSLSDAKGISDLSAFFVHWSGNDEVVAVRFCCYPEFDEPSDLRRVGVDGGSTIVTAAGEVSTADVDGAGTIAFVRPDGTVALLEPDGTIREIELELPATFLGF